jgi:hypothetical protein
MTAAPAFRYNLFLFKGKRKRISTAIGASYDVWDLKTNANKKLNN